MWDKSKPEVSLLEDTWTDRLMIDIHVVIRMCHQATNIPKGNFTFTVKAYGKYIALLSR